METNQNKNQENEKPKKKSSTLVNSLLFLFFLCSPVTYYFLMKHLFSTNDAKIILQNFLPEFWTFETKINLLATVFALIGFFILLIIISVGVSRMITQAHPLGKEPEIITLLNRILLNTIEQFVAFFPLLTYWTLHLSTEENKHHTLIFGLVWVLGRILFLFGYLMNLINMKFAVFRTLGYAMNFGSSVALVFRIFGYAFI